MTLTNKLKEMRRREEGFTIVELLIVIIVIAILAALVITAYLGIQQRARDAERQADIREIANAASLYATENEGLPDCTQIGDGTVDVAEGALIAPGQTTSSFQVGAASANEDQYGCEFDGANEGIQLSWTSEENGFQTRDIGDFQSASVAP